jgi:hypothetical protein
MLMSRYSKRISEKIEKTKSTANPPGKKAGRDILLLILIAVNFLFLILGWSQALIIDKAIYILLECSLISIYAYRHARLNEKNTERLKYMGLTFMGIAFACFIYSAYIRYFAN